MKNRTLFWQFFGTHILILFVAIGVVAFYTWFTSREVFHRQWVRELETQTKMAAALLPHVDGSVDEAAIKRFFERLGHLDDHRLTLILPDGRVIGDSEVDAGRMDRHDDRPEVREAMAHGAGMSRRYSASLGKEMLYLAQRVPLEGPAQAIVRVSVPVRTVTREMDAANHVLVVLLVVVLGATLELRRSVAHRGPRFRFAARVETHRWRGSVVQA